MNYTVRDQLNKLRENIVKLGPERRQKEIGKNKLKESTELYNRAADIVSLLKEQTTNLSHSEIELYNILVGEISEIYGKIKNLLKYFDSTSQTENKMATSGFDIKTAIALLPIMNGQEDITKQLIDAILMYSSLIDNEAQKTLIDFVLKTRVSSSAKLRLKSVYVSVESLVEDMRKFLLPKKSAESIQTQLFRTTQGRRSIEAFGAEIEDLFVNLTISQADGNDSRYEILRPLNEKSAIKRFADGLSDQKLSTIISSRQFTSLPEAIRTAIDEEASSPKDEQMFHYRRYKPISSYRGQFNINRGRNMYGTTYYSNSKNRRNITQPNVEHCPRQQFAGSAQGGRRPHHLATARVQQITDDTANAPSGQDNNDENSNKQFFRE